MSCRVSFPSLSWRLWASPLRLAPTTNTRHPSARRRTRSSSRSDGRRRRSRDCGSYGATLGAGLSLETDALSGWAVEFGVDSQFGLINGVEYGLLPMARVSLAL